jgi:hypothetical protein
MKKMIIAIVGALALGVSANASMKYECWTYEGGQPQKMVYVYADNNAQAVDLAWIKFEEILGKKPLSVKCK